MTTSSSSASSIAVPDLLASRLAVALLDRGAAFSHAAIEHAAAIVAKQSGATTEVALTSVRTALTHRAIPGAEELAPEAAAVLHEVVSHLVAARATEDEERPAFAFADLVDRTGVALETVRPIFEAALLAARSEAQPKTPPQVFVGSPSESATRNPARQDAPRTSIATSRTQSSRSRAARTGSGSPSTVGSAAASKQRSFPPPTSPCPVCRRGTRWFLLDVPGSGGWICATCHPPAIATERFLWSGGSS